jgi:uncharacterized membrane protein
MAEGHKADKGKKSGGGGGLEEMIVEMLPFLAVIAIAFFGYRYFQSTPDGGGIRSVLTSIHGVLTNISTVLSMIFIAIAVYSWIKHNEHSNHEAHEIKHRFHHAKESAEHRQSSSSGGVGDSWKRIDNYVRSENPSDWKIAILEADNLLEEVITQMGYQGDTFGEKLKSIKPAQFPYLDHAWEAHKFRNDIAHGSSDRPLAHSEANRIIGLYERVFRELKVL